MGQQIFTAITLQFPFPLTTIRQRYHTLEDISAHITSQHYTRKDLEEVVDAWTEHLDWTIRYCYSNRIILKNLLHNIRSMIKMFPKILIDQS